VGAFQTNGIFTHLLEESSIIELDKSIRFAGFATKNGDIVASKYRKDVIPLLTLDEAQLSFIDSALMMRIREAREPKLGKVICSIVLYEKVTYTTILVNSEDYPILMVTRIQVPRC
jgi:hypothetical protein